VLDELDTVPEVEVFDQFAQREVDLAEEEDAEGSTFVPVQPRARTRVVDEATQTATGIGRRKTAAARVQITPGSGHFVVNGREMIDYFRVYSMRGAVLQPLVATETLCQFDVQADVSGGGPTGQAGAVRHGLARALERWQPEWRPTLKLGGLLTRDPRMVERKKYVCVCR
jgi:small subunit ribosomal protein S9